MVVSLEENTRRNESACVYARELFSRMRLCARVVNVGAERADEPHSYRALAALQEAGPHNYKHQNTQPDTLLVPFCLYYCDQP